MNEMIGISISIEEVVVYPLIELTLLYDWAVMEDIQLVNNQ